MIAWPVNTKKRTRKEDDENIIKEITGVVIPAV